MQLRRRLSVEWVTGKGRDQIQTRLLKARGRDVRFELGYTMWRGDNDFHTKGELRTCVLRRNG